MAINEQAESAKADFMDGMKRKDIADKYGVSVNTVDSWRKRYGWQKNGAPQMKSSAPKSGALQKKNGAPLGNQNAKGHGPPVGNKNAVGNTGGAPKRNRNAVATGEYQTIWLDMMDETEQALIDSIDTDPVTQIDEDIRLLTFRERRMLQHLNDLKSQKDLVETKTMYEVKKVPVMTEVYDERMGKVRSVKTYKEEKSMVAQEEHKKMLIGQILRIEEALTRVQMAKTRAIESKHRILTALKDGGAKDEAIHITIGRKERRDDGSQ